MKSRAVASFLVWQLAIPVVPLMAGNSGQASGDLSWIEGTIVGVDASQRSVSYRVATGDVETAAVASDAALRKLTGWKVGQRVKLKCRQTGEGRTMVEEAKKAKNGWPWWAWVLTSVAAAGLGWLLLLLAGGD